MWVLMTGCDTHFRASSSKTTSFTRLIFTGRLLLLSFPSVPRDGRPFGIGIFHSTQRHGTKKRFVVFSLFNNKFQNLPLGFLPHRESLESLKSGSRSLMDGARLYRSLFRIALSMPDPHRRNLIVYRARYALRLHHISTATHTSCRTEFEAARSLNAEESTQKLLEMETYLDNLTVSFTPSPSPELYSDTFSTTQYQAEHLNALAKKITLIPVDVRRSSRAATLADSPSATTVVRRRLIEAIKVRTAQNAIPKQHKNRFMNGPKPSWIKD